MVKLVLLLAIIIVVALLVRRLFKSVSTKRAGESEAPPPDADSTEARLVRCVECGAFVPKGQALPVPPNGFRCASGCAGR